MRFLTLFHASVHFSADRTDLCVCARSTAVFYEHFFADCADTCLCTKHYGRSASRSRTLAKEVPDATLQEMIDMIKKGPELDEIYAPSVIHMAQTHIFYLVIVRSCLDPRGYGSARTCSSTCTLSPAGLLHSTRRDPLRVKIREVGRGLSLADTQTGGYVRLYSRRRLCARRGADAQLILRILLEHS